MKILAFGDTQFHPWQEEQRGGDGAQQFLELFDELHRVIKEVKPDAVTFMGDLFEAKRSPRIDIVSRVLVRMTNLASSIGIDETKIWIAMTGNHDLYRGESSLSALSAPWEVVGGEGNQVEQSWNELPYAKLAEGSIRWTPFGYGGSDDFPDVIFSHEEFAHKPMGPHAVEPKWIDEAVGKVKMIVNGHYHQPEQYMQGNTLIVHVGAWAQYNWTDIDSGKRGCWLIDTEEISAEFIELGKNLPKFVSASEDARAIDFQRPDVKVDDPINAVEREEGEVIGGDDLVGSLRAYTRLKVEGERRRKATVNLGASIINEAIGG